MVLLGRRTAFQRRFGTNSAELVYGQTLRVPGDLLLTGDTGVAEADPDTVIAKLQAKTCRPVPPTTGLHSRSINWPETAEKATHVYVKKGKPTPLGPIKMGPFPILERPSKSTLKLIVGTNPDGSRKTEIQHWENCQPAALEVGAKVAERPKRGRKPKEAPPSTPGTAPAPTGDTSTPTTKAAPATRAATPTGRPPEGAAPKRVEEKAPPPTSQPAKTRSGRVVKPNKNKDYEY